MTQLSQLSSLQAEIKRHPVYANPYFERLKYSRWTGDTYALHRANFFYRTELTVKAIAHVCARAADNDDVPTLILFSHILNEECGNGDKAKCHLLLMEQSHNLFGKDAFRLPPLSVIEARKSALIVEGTNRYRQRIQELCGSSYQQVLGVAMALESHAKEMLGYCRTAFRANADTLDIEQFVNEIEVYFNVHLNGGVEERHAVDARECVRSNCRSEQDFKEIAFGARETLNIQLAMWQDLEQVANKMEIKYRHD
jgi:heme oxygenase-like protein